MSKAASELMKQERQLLRSIWSTFISLLVAFDIAPMKTEVCKRPLLCLSVDEFLLRNIWNCRIYVLRINVELSSTAKVTILNDW